MTRFRLPFALAVGLLLTFAAVALGHTGAIHAAQSCNNGTTINAHLDANVAAQATFTVRVNGSVVDSGSGPGPRDLGPYAAGFAAGTASLTISFHQETNVYPVSFEEVHECAPSSSTPPTTTPSASPSPTVPATSSPTPPPPSPTATPAPSSTPGLPTPRTTPIPSSSTPNPTLPPSDAISPTPTPSSPSAPVGYLLAFALVFGVALVMRRVR